MIDRKSAFKPIAGQDPIRHEDPRVIDQDIEPAVLPHDFFSEPSNFIERREIRGEAAKVPVPARPDTFAQNLLAPSQMFAVQDNGRPPPGKLERCLLANAVGRSRHQNYSSL
jgi:hypothetical protein